MTTSFNLLMPSPPVLFLPWLLLALCMLQAYAVHALVGVFSGHGRPQLNMQYGMRVLVDPTATRLLGIYVWSCCQP